MNSSATDVVQFDNRDERLDLRNVRGDGRAGEAAQDVHEPRPEAQEEKKKGETKRIRKCSSLPKREIYRSLSLA